MKEHLKNFSIRKIIIILFISAVFVSLSSIGFLIFKNWFSSAKKTTVSIAEDISENIYSRIYSFLQTPNHINEVNHRIIENGILDLSDEKLREKFFVGVLSTHNSEIYSFSYGTVNGEYYGARRNENGVIEIMRNNSDTGGHSWYYTVNEDMTAEDLVVNAGIFDPRTREWYKAAVEAKGPAFAPVYKHFVMNDLTVSAALPVYSKSGELQGVIGTHMLLTDIGGYLKDSVNKYNGRAVIFEKDSNYLIANSMGMNNFNVSADGIIDRLRIDQIEDSNFKSAYEKYNLNPDPLFLHKSKDENLYVSVKELKMEGLEWVIISAFPDELLIKPVVYSIRVTVLLSILALFFTFIIFNTIIRRLLMPVNSLLKTSEAISHGDLTQRVDIVRNDEIGRISESFNTVADNMQLFINNLEAAVKERTKELYNANVTLEDNKNQLQLILNSTVEAIYGIDLKGNCIFCNTSCIKLLGYEKQEDLLGKNMHWQIHHSRSDGTPFPIEECRILKSIRDGKGYEADDEVFWKADGSYFDVEYHSYPQMRNGKVVGGVITFIDISERKKREKEIQYLSYHDILTGLPNRRYFEANLPRIDTVDNLPLTVIFADINGLKMTNDIFGHSAGDELIKKSAEILMQSCTENSMITRMGGDEFTIVLPKTNKENAKIVMSQIRSGFSNARVEAIKCSISLGSDTKQNADTPLKEIIANAENEMYKDKTMNRKSVNKDIIDTIVETLHLKNPKEKQHSIAVRELCSKVGYALHLPEPEIDKLKRVGYLHDIGKIILDEGILSKEILTDEELEKMKQHSVVGYRILNLFDDSLDLAEYIYSHHERWDGDGYPRGLKGEQIPLISRIVSIVETYDRILNRGNLSLTERKDKAIEIIRGEAGKQFDPKITELFIQMLD